MKIHHLGTCPLTGQRCLITAEYRDASTFRAAMFIREYTECSLGACESQADCREYDHFPDEMS